MNYSSIHPAYVVKTKIYVDKKTIFIMLPDTNLDISAEIYNSNFLLSNCMGLVCPSKVLTIGKRKFSGKAHFFDVKKKLSANASDQKIGKRIRVLNTLIIEKPEKEVLSSSHKTSNYYFYDATVWSQALEFMMQRYSEKTVVRQLFEELATLYKQIKSNNQDYNVEVLFLIKNQGGRLYDILSKIRTFIKADDLKTIKFFDEFSLISDCQEVTIPIFDIDKSETQLIVANLLKLKQYIEDNTTVEDINKSKENAIAGETEDGSINKPENEQETNIESTKSEDDKEPSFISGIVKSLQTSTLIADKDPDTSKIRVKLNQDELRKALKAHKIADPDIVANVQIAINKYIEDNKTKPNQEQAEDLVLRAINYTISGSDIVPDEYLHKPNLLFSKLKQIDYYKNDLNLSESDNIINPSSIIDLKYTTGQHRQKFEFETAIHENVIKLFNSLESIGTEYPIKIKKISSSVEDDNSNRFINYKVTLQNINGGKKEPYVVELKVPSPVNEKYFKLHGNSYIMSNQQFLRPVTKTDKNEVRMISNYGIVRVGLANSKFNPTDLIEITKYAEIRYPKLIKKRDENSCEFNDGSIIYFTGENIYSSKDKNITTDTESGRLQDVESKELLKQNKYEFLFDTILDKIHTANPVDNLTKTKKALPYIWIYMGAIKMPLILYLWSQKGLLATLNEYGIDYEIVDTNTPEPGVFYVAQADGKFLKITPENLKQRVMVNALSTIKLKEPIKDLNDPQEIYNYIIQTYGTRSIILLRLNSENFVDPITKELLQFENMPTNLTELSSKVAVDQLLNKRMDSLSDLKIYRARLSEIILNIVYKVIKLSHNTYRKRITEGDQQAAVFLDPDYIINSLLTDAGVLQNTEPVAPITEIMLSSRVTKGGRGGVPSRKSFKKEHRNIHKSQYGNMGAVSTPEYVDVGLTTHHTLTPIIINKYGSYGAKDITQLSGWQTLALDESLTPFQNQVDSDRLTLARTHANQTTPISDSEQPLVCTGAEFIVPQLASPRFIHRAKHDGIVTNVDKNKTLSVKYKNGTTDIFDIVPRMSRTKRGSYISLEMNSLGVDEKFKANQPVAFTKNFNQAGTYCAGKNINIALFNYMGLNHEDSYIISKELADQTMTDSVEEVQAIIPPNTKIINLETEKGKHIKSGDILVEFSYDDSLDEYLDSTNLDIEDDDSESSQNIFSAGSKSIKLLAPEGEIVDIKIFINNKNSADKQLMIFHSNLVKEQKQVIAKLASVIKDKDKQLSITDNMDLSFINIGDHKLKGNIFVGTRIVYYIKRLKSVNIGDKLSNRFGNQMCRLLEQSRLNNSVNSVEHLIK